MKATRLFFACLLPLAVAACGVPDIVAHGVKEFDRGQTQAKPASAPAERNAPAPAVMREEPPPAMAPSPVVPRDSVTVETLPPPQ